MRFVQLITEKWLQTVCNTVSHSMVLVKSHIALLVRSLVMVWSQCWVALVVLLLCHQGHNSTLTAPSKHLAKCDSSELAYDDIFLYMTFIPSLVLCARFYPSTFWFWNVLFVCLFVCLFFQSVASLFTMLLNLQFLLVLLARKLPILAPHSMSCCSSLTPPVPSPPPSVSFWTCLLSASSFLFIHILSDHTEDVREEGSRKGGGRRKMPPGMENNPVVALSFQCNAL